MHKSEDLKRSRNGCERCRRRRQKCDEERPTCRRCSEAETTCTYALNIRWIGRSFHRSQYRHRPVRKDEVISVNSAYLSSATPSITIEYADPHRMNFSPPPSISLTSLFSEVQCQATTGSTCSDLLEYFIHVASQSMCTHQQSRLESCQALMPMLQTVPSLLSAVLSYSAAHRTAERSQSTQPVDKTLAIRLKLTSIRQLREEVGSSGPIQEGTLATSIMLLQCILIHDDDDFRSWRMFLRGARTALIAITTWRSKSASTCLSPSFLYLRDRYRLFELVAMLSPAGFPAHETFEDDLPNLNEDLSTATARTNFFLEKYGCSTNVRRLLRNIAALAWERRRLPNSDEPLVATSILSTLDVIQEARALEAELISTIECDENVQPTFFPHILELLTEDQVFEFMTCNQIYEHMLLLYLRTEVLRMMTTSSEVQEPVRKIIMLTSLVTPHRGLSPSTGLNTALFIAGRHALPSDRPAILSLLSSFFTSTRNYNMVRAQNELIKYWSEFPSPDLEQNRQDTTDFLAF